MTNVASPLVTPLAMDRNLRSSKLVQDNSNELLCVESSNAHLQRFEVSSSEEECVAAVMKDAEESLMHHGDVDEEIRSINSDGEPILDIEQIENRMLTVAVVNSVVHTSADSASNEETIHQRYSLRKRARSRSQSSEGSGSGNSRPRHGLPISPGGASTYSPGGTRYSTRSQSKRFKEGPPVESKEYATAQAGPLQQLAEPIAREMEQQAAPLVSSPSIPIKLVVPVPAVPVAPPPQPRVVIPAPAPPAPSLPTTIPIPIIQEVPIPKAHPVIDPRRVPNPLLGIVSPSILPPEDKGTQVVITQVSVVNSAFTSSTTTTLNGVSHGTVNGHPILTIEHAANNGNATVPPPVACPLPASNSHVTANGQETTTPAKYEAYENNMQRRGRIFSIDIDPEGLDFPDLGIVDAINQQSELSAAPLPCISTTASGGGQHIMNIALHPGSQTHQEHVLPRHEEPEANPDLFNVGGRDRAMSFEFFSFGINADEPLPPAPDLAPNNEHIYGRLRGDSIIFDPVSFREGGILEEGSLMKSRGNSIDIGITEEMAIMNTPGFVPAPVMPHAEMNNDASAYLQAIPADHHATAIHAPSNGSANAGSFILPSQAGPPPSSSRLPTISVGLNEASGPFGGKPGSAVGSVQMATLPSSLSGTSMSHSTFQMELLNKDGRIGIYLPEARKARIAKFHSKRKMRIWRKRIKYDCRKKLADSRPRIKGRFVKRSDMDGEEEEL